MKLTDPGVALRGLAVLALLALTPLHAQESPEPPSPQPSPAPAATPRPIQANLNITPKRLVLGRDKRIASIYVFNQGDVPVTADVTIVDRVMLPDGQLKPLDEAAAKAELKPIADRVHAARNFMMATPRRITLMPGRGQTVRLRAVLPADADAAEYRSHLTVVTVPPRDTGVTAKDADAQQARELSIRINAVFGISIPVIVRNGPADARAEIRDPRLTEEAIPSGEGAPPRPTPALSFDIARLGANSLYGSIEIRSAAGQKDLLGLARGIGVYPEIDGRSVRILLQRRPESGETLDIRFIDDDAEPGRVLARQSFTAP